MKISYLSPAALALTALALGSCRDRHNPGNDPLGTVLYVENNVAGDNQNGILAYHLSSSGSLELLAGAPFATGGAGATNPGQVLGPDDTDDPIALSPDKKRLFAVNQGSNTIAVFDVQLGGKLTPVAGSPFPSGGNNPCSIGVVGNRLFVVNKSDDGNPATTDPAPNYVAFDVATSGALTLVPGSTFTTTVGTSPTHAYVSPNQRLLFVDEFLGFALPNAQPTLRAFAIGADGHLTPAPGTPQFSPLRTPENPASTTQGIWAHPFENVLYVDFPLQNAVGVYTYNPTTGTPTFVRSISSGTPGTKLTTAPCWQRINKAGTRMYVLNSGEGTVSVFDVTRPQYPTQTQVLALKNIGPVQKGGGPQVVSSQPFHLTFSPDEQTLLVVSQHATPDFSTNYNYLHALVINADGSLREPYAPVQPPVDAHTRPQGAVTLAF